jgi:hypothetical protein
MGAPKGFSSYLIKTGQYKGKEGNTPAEFKTMIQLGDYKDGIYAIFQQTSWIIQRFRRVNQVSLVALPLASAASLVVSTTLLDRTHFVDGLVVGNFRVKRMVL